MNSSKIAEQLLAHYWARKPIPVDFQSIAQSMGLNINYVQGEEEAIATNGKKVTIWANTGWRQKRLIAFVVARHALRGMGHWYEGQDYSVTESDVYEIEGTNWEKSYDPLYSFPKLISEKMLVPSYALKVLVVDRGITSVESLSQSFLVSEKMLVQRLRDERYIN